ncbi:hypothetical protein DER44DRAFT_783066 [Fusarium oxysporum]|nr:hypothetical protein DER44DRAFT_783066 [Fusarium oxysporum]
MPLFLKVVLFHFLAGPSSSLSEPKMPSAAFSLLLPPTRRLFRGLKSPKSLSASRPGVRCSSSDSDADEEYSAAAALVRREGSKEGRDEPFILRVFLITLYMSFVSSACESALEAWRSNTCDATGRRRNKLEAWA